MGNRALEILQVLIDDLREIEGSESPDPKFLKEEVGHARGEAEAALERARLLGDLAGQ